VKLIDLTDPFFKPVWVRVAVVIVACVWGAYEFASGAALWGCIFVGIGLISAIRFATIDYGADNANSGPNESESP